ncbi:hypothetical protein [Streptomyces sp. NBC_00344]|uniref:hypothetical protein n=1 Tax=Streptomyces sp. NBC_00344 TaxID=2975720 RepID=UPI002E1B20E9
MQHRLRTALAAAATADLTGSPLAAGADGASAAPSGRQGDFNRDGCRDLASATRMSSAGGKQDTGGVIVVHGAAKRLDPSRRTVIATYLRGAPGAGFPATGSIGFGPGSPGRPTSCGDFGDRLTG